MSEVIYKAAPDPNARLPKLSAKQKQQEFIEFVWRLPRPFETRDSLELAIDLLVVSRAQPGVWSQLTRACGAPSVQTMSVLHFLHRQGLVRCDWMVYRALPGAVDELLYRLHHNGWGSWPEAEPPLVVDPHAQARQEARSKLKAALKQAGYRPRGDARLRVVK